VTEKMNAGGTPVTEAPERYKLVRRLGSGAFGTVYLARDLFLDEDCAVKMPLKPHPDMREFLQEPRLLNRVKSPAIVALRDIESIQGVLCLVMEFVGGGSLRDRMGKAGQGRPMPLSFAVRVTREVLAALKAAHSVGVLHRDIKPDNVLLTEEGHAKVTDFGIARIVEASGGIDFTMHPGGTMIYMSPEALAGECSPASDIWSTAVLFYELLCGRFPFPGPATAQIVHQIEEGRIVSILEQNANVGDAVAKVVHKSLLRAREQRYPDIDSFDRALAALGETGSTDPITGRLPAPAAAEINQRFQSVVGHREEAERNLGALIAAAPTRAKDGEFPEVVDELRALLADHAGHPGLHRALAQVYRDHGDDGWAYDEYERAFLLDRTDRVAAEGLADLGLRLRRPHRTIEALVALVEIEPQSASYLRRLAMALAQEGDRTRALAQMRRSLEVDPNQSHARRILQRWEKGGSPGEREG